jgi:hypothetical protein
MRQHRPQTGHKQVSLTKQTMTVFAFTSCGSLEYPLLQSFHCQTTWNEFLHRQGSAQWATDRGALVSNIE